MTAGLSPFTLLQPKVDLVAKLGPKTSLDDLLQAPSLDTARPAVEPQAVDIGTLLYRGARARQRAQELRETAKRVSGNDLRAIIDEVCDLVVLAIEPES